MNGRRLLSVSAAIGLLALLSACAPSDDVQPSGTGLDGGDTPMTEIEVDAAWLDGGRMLALITEGSSTCIPVVEEVGIQDNGTLGVVLADPEADTPCTKDLVPRVTLVEVPSGVDPTADLEIAIAGDDYYGDTELDGVPGLDPANLDTQYAPSAGWTDIDGTFVILTWGSSSCKPVIASTTATTPNEVTTTFETPPADQVCTMDMAPRATLATVEGAAEDAAVELVLTGAEFSDVRLPIYGTN